MQALLKLQCGLADSELFEELPLVVHYWVMKFLAMYTGNPRQYAWARRLLIVFLLGINVGGCCWSGKQYGFFMEPKTNGPIRELFQTRADLGLGPAKDSEKALQRILDRDYLGKYLDSEFNDFIEHYDGECSAGYSDREQVCKIRYSYNAYKACNELYASQKTEVKIYIVEEKGLIRKIDVEIKRDSALIKR